MSAENLSPSYLRINEKGAVPTLVVPLAETAGQEVATKFRALTDSIEIAAFIDASRSPQILEIKGESDVKPAPMLSPATIEGKAANDALIKVICFRKSRGSTTDARSLKIPAIPTARSRSGLRSQCSPPRSAHLRRARVAAQKPRRSILPYKVRTVL